MPPENHKSPVPPEETFESYFDYPPKIKPTIKWKDIENTNEQENGFPSDN